MNIFKVMLASAFGAVLAITLGSYVSGHPYALILWGLIGGFAGFVCVGPKQFVVEWQKKYYDYASQRLDRKKQERLRRMEDDALLLQHDEYVSAMYSQSRYFLATCIGVGFWFLLFCRKITASHMSLSEHLTVSGLAFVVMLLMFFLVGVFNVRKIVVEIIRSEGTISITENLPKTLLQRQRSKIDFLKVTFWPIWLVIWGVINTRFIIECLFITLARTCKFVASLGRYAAMFGAIVGFVVGWVYGRDIPFGALIGAIAGGGVYLLVQSAKFFSFLLPQKMRWPVSRPVMSA